MLMILNRMGVNNEKSHCTADAGAVVIIRAYSIVRYQLAVA
jgi:hypothetical protein